jgi:hypothetical protein
MYLTKDHFMLSMVVFACNPSIQEVEAGCAQVQGYPGQ